MRGNTVLMKIVELMNMLWPNMKNKLPSDDNSS